MRRSTRLTNAFSKKSWNHAAALTTTFCLRHTTLRVTPAQTAGLTDTWHHAEWIVGLIDTRTPKPGMRGPYKKRAKAQNSN